jgi:hypothetical protein
MSNLSGIISNGQTLNLRAGTGAINAGDLIQVGGPAGEAWSVVTSDHAALSIQQVITPVTIEAGAVNNYARWGIETDTLGNVFTATPNASSQGVAITKYAPSGALLAGPIVVDATAHAMISIRLIVLSNGAYATIYADSTTGGVRFVVFDSNLNIIAGPTAVATGYLSGAVAYADACPLLGGGFAVVYQNSLHTAIDLQTYTNAGGAVLAATSIQALTGTALAYLRINQLHSGNLVVGIRTTATPAGTSFVIVTTAGVSVQTNVIVDSTATAGFLSLSVLTGGGFAIGCQDGTNAVAAVYNDAGAAQGSAYTSADTLNSTTYIQFKVTNDGTNFYFAYVQSSGGLTVVQLTPAGVSTVLASSLISATFTSTSSIDGMICNNTLVMLRASITNGGQQYVTIGLPDASIGAFYAEVISGPTAVGSAAATTGSYWPTLRAVGDFTALTVYDQQTTAAVLFGIIKFASSTIQGVAQNAVVAGNPGANVTINPGAGSYPLPNGIAGSSALLFDHSGTGGNKGSIFSGGVSLSNPAAAPVVSGSLASLAAILTTGPLSYTYVASAAVGITVVCGTSGGGGGAVVIGGARIGPGSSLYEQLIVPLNLAAGQSVTIATEVGASAIISIGAPR